MDTLPSGGRKSPAVSVSFILHVLIYFCSTPTSYGIFKFKPDASSISGPVMPDSLQVSPAGNKATVVVVSLNKRFIHISRDYGKTWDKHISPTSYFDPTNEFYLSGFNPQHMVIRGSTGEVRGHQQLCVKK